MEVQTDDKQASDSVVNPQQLIYASPYAPIEMNEPLSHHFQSKRDAYLTGLVNNATEPAWIVPAFSNTSSYVNLGMDLIYLNATAPESDNMNAFICTLTNMTIQSVFIEMGFDQLMREFYFLILKPKNINVNWVNYMLKIGKFIQIYMHIYLTFKM